jgi:hypothetical protein
VVISGAGFVASTMSKNFDPAGPTMFPLSTTIHLTVVSCVICSDLDTPETNVSLCSVGVEPSVV